MGKKNKTKTCKAPEQYRQDVDMQKKDEEDNSSFYNIDRLLQEGRNNKAKYLKINERISHVSKHMKRSDDVILQQIRQCVRTDFKLNNDCNFYDTKDQAQSAWIINAVKESHRDILKLFDEKNRRFEHAQLQIIYSTLISIACTYGGSVSYGENAFYMVGRGLNIDTVKMACAENITSLYDHYAHIVDAYDARFSKLSMPRRMGKTEIMGALTAAVQYRFSPKDILLIAHVKMVVETGVKSAYEKYLNRLIEINDRISPKFFVYPGGYYASHSSSFKFKWNENWSAFGIESPNTNSDNPTGGCMAIVTSGGAVRGQDSSFVVMDETAATRSSTLTAAIPLGSSQKCHILMASTKALNKKSAFWDKWSYLCKNNNPLNKKIFNTIETFMNCPFCLKAVDVYNVNFSHNISCAHYAHFLPPHTLADQDVHLVLSALGKNLGQKELQGIGDMDMDSKDLMCMKKTTQMHRVITFESLCDVFQDRIDIRTEDVLCMYTYIDPSLSVQHCMGITTVAIVYESNQPCSRNEDHEDTEGDDTVPPIYTLYDYKMVVLGLDQIPLSQYDHAVNASCLYTHVTNIYKMHPELVGKQHVIIAEGNHVEILPMNTYIILNSLVETNLPSEVNLLYFTRLKQALRDNFLKDRQDRTIYHATHTINKQHAFCNESDYTHKVFHHYRMGADMQFHVVSKNDPDYYKIRDNIKGFILDEQNKTTAYTTMCNLLNSRKIAISNRLISENTYSVQDHIMFNNRVSSTSKYSKQITQELQNRDNIKHALSVKQDIFQSLSSSLPKHVVSNSDDDNQSVVSDATAQQRPSRWSETTLSNITDEDIQLPEFKQLLLKNEHREFIQIESISRSNQMIVDLYRQLMKSAVKRKKAFRKIKSDVVTQQVMTSKPDDMMVSFMCALYVAYCSLHDASSLSALLLKM